MKLKDRLRTMNDNELVEFMQIYDAEIALDKYCAVCPLKGTGKCTDDDIECKGDDGTGISWFLDLEYDKAVGLLNEGFAYEKKWG